MVVDDGSRSEVGDVVAAASAQGPVEMHYVRQEPSGLNRARNRGAAVARGDVLAFLDDDTLVAPGWGQALLHAFDRYPCAGVGGRIELSLAAPAPHWLGELTCYLAEYDRGPEACWLEDDPLPVGANCAVRRIDFERSGGFRVGLDRIADSLVSNGDTEFFGRLRGMGGRLRYEPEASVLHCVPADRLTVRYFSARHRAQGVSDELLLRLQGDVPSLGHRLGLVRELVNAGKWFWKEAVAGRETVRPRLLMAYWLGRLYPGRSAGAPGAASSSSSGAPCACS